MSKISDQQLTQIKEAVNIVDVINQFVTLQKKGSGFLGLCPFHGDRSPSMRVCQTRQTYKCFVCGAGGDVFSFLQSHENMTFPDAVRFCANLAGIELKEEELTNEEIQLRKQKEGLYIAIEAATTFYQQQLPSIASYLQDRGYNVTDDVVKAFRIGYAPEGNAALKELSKRGYNPEMLEKTNVIARSKYGSNYDVFQDRLVFPFLDNQGRPIGYSGRIIKPKEGVGKYVNTNDTPLFRKGNVIFGLYQARQSIGRLEHAYLVEGQFDVTSMHSVGVTNTIAGSGTALTDEQIKLLSRYTRKVTIMYDSDKAGIAATLKNCRSMLLQGFSVSCILLKEGTDPDNLAREEQEKTMVWLKNHTIDLVSYFCALSTPEKIEDPICKEEKLKEICEVVACCQEESLRNSYINIISKRFGSESAVLRKKIKELRSELPQLPPAEEMKEGIYGLDILDKESPSVFFTDDFDTFMEGYGEEPIVLIKGKLSMDSIQEIRRSVRLIDADANDIYVNKSGEESTVMSALAECFKNGITEISVEMPGADTPGDDEDDDDYIEDEKEDQCWIFPNAYVYKYYQFISRQKPYDATPYIQRCAEIIACADDSVRIVNMSYYKDWLDLTKGELNEVMKPFISKRKSRMAINAQRKDDEYDYDPDTIPDYVENEPIYAQMYQQCKFYPKLNKDGVPVCYIFKNGNDKGHTMVGDFFMEPLLHITSEVDEDNKRVVKINRRYYKKPIFLEVNSKSMLKKSTIEERLIMLEAVNFSDGEEKHWTKIREWMSRNFVTCKEIKVYGNQQTDGHSRDERNMFFSFANGIYHQVDGNWQFDAVNELGVVTHNKENYYLPAFSTIYAGADNQDKYEQISTLFYKEVPSNEQCTFEKWATLMDKVYKMNDNGKWAVLFGIMCAFRSNIHAIDRLFTAPFFMGPMSSGKTQIAISIRSLFVSPKVPIFNLNIGTDAAMSTLMGTFRDVPVVLDEYNNNDITDNKFQALKGIVYDGDGKQKRKGTSGREIENDKVYAPVIICGQETPQRDDNALMSRIIVCEVPKPIVERTQEEIDMFQELKDIEAAGLSNVLTDILKLRSTVMDKFRTLKLEAYKELKNKMNSTGEIDRLMKTASLFLATCRIIQDYSELSLPFTYDEFFTVALNKIRLQVDMISKSDKLATFFKAIDVMIDNKTIIEGRDYHIEAADKLTIKTAGNERQEIALPSGTKVLYLRFSNLYVHFKRLDKEGSSDTTLLQNLRSNPSFLGAVNSHRFAWFETVETAKGAYDADDPDKAAGDLTMIKKRKPMSTNTSCLALNYDLFKEAYGIDLQRGGEESTSNQDENKEPLPF